MKMRADLKEIKQLQREVTNTNQQFKSLSSVLRSGLGFAGLVGGIGLTTAGITSLIRSSIQLGSNLDDTSKKLGVSTDFLQGFSFAARETGTSTRAAEMGLQRFIRRLAEASTGKGELLPILEQYNIQVRNTDGVTRNAIDVLGDLAEVIKFAETPAERLRIAFKAFDSEGAGLVNVLRDGKEGFDRWIESAKEAGQVMDQETIKRLAEAENALERYQTDLTIIAGKIVASLQLSGEQMGEAYSLITDGSFEQGWIRLNQALGQLPQDFGGVQTATDAATDAMAALNTETLVTIETAEEAAKKLKELERAQEGLAKAREELSQIRRYGMESPGQRVDRLRRSAIIDTLNADVRRNSGNETEAIRFETEAAEKRAEALKLEHQLLEQKEQLTGEFRNAQLEELSTAQQIQVVEKELVENQRQAKLAMGLESGQQLERLLSLGKQRLALEGKLKVLKEDETRATDSRVQAEIDVTREQIEQVRQQKELAAIRGDNGTIETLIGQEQNLIDELIGKYGALRDSIVETDPAGAAALTTRIEGLKVERYRAGASSNTGGVTFAQSAQEQYSRYQNEYGDYGVSAIGGARAALQNYVADVGQLGQVFNRTTSQIATGMEGSIQPALDGLINGTLTWEDALSLVGSSMVTTLVQAFTTMVTQMVVQYIANQILMATSASATQTALATQMAALGAAVNASWAPAATSASIATYGSAAGIGSAAYLASLASTVAAASAVQGAGAIDIGGFFGGFRERGGPVEAGVPYIVGEKRPEVFVPNVPGNIVPSLSEFVTDYSGGGSGTSTNGKPSETNIALIGMESEMRRFMESAKGQRIVLDAMNRNRTRMGVFG